MAAVARYAFANLEGFQLQLVEIHDFAPLAETALHEQPRERFFGLVGRREVNVPEIVARLENVYGVEKSIRILIDFGNHARPRILPLVAFCESPQMELLARFQLFGEAQHPPIAADQERLDRLRERSALHRSPGCFDGHAEADTIALAQSIR